ncbi:22185_t:CDS:2, partial [Racocetra persica]
KGILFIELCDTGIGISPEYMQHIWKSFSQGDMSITKEQDGTGLGLSICKSLVEINGGEIKAESRLGKGIESVRNSLLKYLEKVEKVDALDTFDKGIIAAKTYNERAYDIIFISLYENNKEEVISAVLELKKLEIN